MAPSNAFSSAYQRGFARKVRVLCVCPTSQSYNLFSSRCSWRELNSCLLAPQMFLPSLAKLRNLPGLALFLKLFQSVNYYGSASYTPLLTLSFRHENQTTSCEFTAECPQESHCRLQKRSWTFWLP